MRTIPTVQSPECSRRRVLAGLGGTGLASLAGCLSGKAEGSVADDTFTGAIEIVPTELQPNAYNANQYDEQWMCATFERLLRYNTRTDEHVPAAIAEWENEGGAWRFRLREGLTWHDGESVTSEDLAAKLVLDAGMGARLGAQASAEDVSTVDERTVRVDFERPLAPFFVLSALEGRVFLDTPRHVYTEYLERFRDATTEDEREAVRTDLVQFAPREPVVGNSPWRVAERSKRRILHERFDGHPAAADINWEFYEFLHIASNEQRWQALSGGETDGYGPVFAPAKVHEAMPDHVERVLFPDYWGLGVLFDHDDSHLGKRAVRQAIAFAIDRETVANNAGAEVKEPVGIPAGVPGWVGGSAETWFEGVRSAFETYGVDAARGERAADMLRSAGYTRDDGDRWTDESGDPITVPIIVPAGWSDWVISAETIATHLRDIGIDAEAATISQERYFSQLEGGEFTAACVGWGAHDPHPYFTLEMAFGESTGQGRWGLPASYTAATLEGGEETVTPAERLVEIPRLSDEAAIREAIQGLARIYNDALPLLPIQEKLMQQWLTRDDWSFPASDSDHLGVEIPIHYLNRIGEMGARE